MNKLENIKLQYIIPSSIGRDEQVKALCESIDAKLRQVAAEAELVLLLPRLDELKEAVIDELAWQYHVDFYDYQLPLAKKRALVSKAIDWHRRKGTPGVIVDAVTSVYGNCLLEEWWEYGGDPYHFRVKTILYSEEDAKRQFLKAKKFILQLKNTRSWLDKFMIYYPDIILPIPIKQSAHIIGMVNAIHNNWNLADNAEDIHWDGVYMWDGTADWSGLRYYGNYNTMQRHQALVAGYTAPWQFVWYEHGVAVAAEQVAYMLIPIKQSAHITEKEIFVMQKIVSNYSSASAKSDAKQYGTPLVKGDMSGSYVLDGMHDLSDCYEVNTNMVNIVCCEKINVAGMAIEGSFEKL